MKHSAASQNLLACHFCAAISRPAANGNTGELRCPRCGSALHSRKPASLQRTWALLISAAVLYIPANLLPVMTVVYLGKGQADTIMSGVIHLLEGGMWPLALIVFIASVFVPLVKLFVLSFLLLSIQLRSQWQPAERTRLYRFTEFVGRWSMVDIFVIAILAALVQFGSLANITPGAGSVSFAAVVILTMFAANTFDPRLIWDAMESNNE